MYIRKDNIFVLNKIIMCSQVVNDQAPTSSKLKPKSQRKKRAPAKHGNTPDNTKKQKPEKRPQVRSKAKF